MKFSKPITDVIKKRTSWRTYTNVPLEHDVREKMINLMKDNDFGSPFSEQAGKTRFELLNIPEFDPSEKENLGTYGTIEGAQNFIVGAIRNLFMTVNILGILWNQLYWLLLILALEQSGWAVPSIVAYFQLK